jgi:hypothetical protein
MSNDRDDLVSLLLVSGPSLSSKGWNRAILCLYEESTLVFRRGLSYDVTQASTHSEV